MKHIKDGKVAVLLMAGGQVSYFLK